MTEYSAFRRSCLPVGSPTSKLSRTARFGSGKTIFCAVIMFSIVGQSAGATAASTRRLRLTPKCAGKSVLCTRGSGLGKTGQPVAACGLRSLRAQFLEDRVQLVHE